MDGTNSISQVNLEDLRRKLAAGDGITGIVAVSAVSASLAAAVAEMALTVAERKKNSSLVLSLRQLARTSSAHFMQLADQDRAVYAQYRDALKLPKDTDVRREAIKAALRRATEVPLAAARAAVSAIDLCNQAGTLLEGEIAADVNGAAELLAGAARAILQSVNANLRKLEHEPFYSELAEQRDELERKITPRR